MVIEEEDDDVKIPGSIPTTSNFYSHKTHDQVHLRLVDGSISIALVWMDPYLLLCSAKQSALIGRRIAAPKEERGSVVNTEEEIICAMFQ